MWKSARRLGVKPPEIDDVFQETFLNVHRLLDRYEPRGSMQAWLFSVLFRVVQHHRRYYRRRPAVAAEDTSVDVDSFAESSARSPDESAEAKETARILEEILDDLDPDKRAVIVLADIEEKTISEIAEILSINVNTASSRLRFAREHVNAAFARHRARDGWRYK
ncbi:RNA polymerase sigma factor RpoE [Labilithrix luteola]|uniref:RNA polymerase sigma factor RpoE n=1 Tax=Labilithrix luteola TaxID=1391654 RepID=A0A0K1Q006_9BACT|nr:RNA polymerase sigma factor RpoE [Labilithrix luteola]